MDAEQLVCSLENATKFQELGVTVDSYFVWALTRDNEYFVESKEFAIGSNLSAYTAGELGQMLPDYTETIRKHEEGSAWWVFTDSCFLGARVKDKWTFAASECDARALMLIWLIENGHLTLDEINQ